MFRSSLIGLVSSLALISAANAADMYVPAAGGYKDVPAYTVNWTGFYLGATAGYAWGDSRFYDFEVTNSFNVDGFTGGGEIGYNFQFSPNWVAGIDADISSGISGKFGPGELNTPSGSSWNCGSGACVTDVNWYGTVRGRLGYAFNNVLVYGTGGLAYGGVDSRIENSSTYKVSSTNTGWTAGGGVEYMFAPNWSGKIEYLHIDLGWTPEPLSLKSETEFDVVRAGVNYHVGSVYQPLK
ncbi:MAG: outer membrane protein [Rhodomicrobium sp.]